MTVDGWVARQQLNKHNEKERQTLDISSAQYPVIIVDKPHGGADIGPRKQARYQRQRHTEVKVSIITRYGCMMELACQCNYYIRYPHIYS